MKRRPSPSVGEAVTVVAPAPTADTVVSEDTAHLGHVVQHPAVSAVRVSGAPEPGTIIHGVYRILDKLASGGMGVVMLAKDEHLERLVAIKLVRPELLDDAGLRARFLMEARAMASVRDPHVVQIYAFGEHWGAPYFVMEYVEGSTVQTWLSELHGAAPDVALALRMLDDACHGLSAIHAAGAIHRDVKPSNLLLDRAFRVRVADFGVADLHPRAGTGEKREIVGTPEFMAPETVSGPFVPPELAERADVYSLACVAFEMLTGTPPFCADDARARMMAHVEREPPRPSDVRPDLPPELDDVILRALAKDPAKRTPSVEAFRRGLAAAAERASEPVRILLADDDPDFCQLLSISLEREFPGVEIRTAANGSEALEAFDREPHSVAILDLQMPGLDGIELTALLRARDTDGKVPIVVITANGGASEWKRLSEMGADGFLVKPVHAKDVVTLVRRALSDRRSTPRAPH